MKKALKKILTAKHSNILKEDFLFLPESVLEDGMLLGIYPFLLGCSLHWHRIVHNSFFESFCASVLSVITSVSFLILFI